MCQLSENVYLLLHKGSWMAFKIKTGLNYKEEELECWCGVAVDMDNRSVDSHHLKNYQDNQRKKPSIEDLLKRMNLGKQQNQEGQQIPRGCSTISYS